MRCRRDYRDLTAAEKARYVAALYDAKARGVVDAFADEHNAHFSHGHNNSSFLPWHREFLRRFEAELQVSDPRVMLCYWNSSNDQSTGSGLWDVSFLGQFDAAWGLGRSLGNGGFLASPETVDGVLDLATYDAFWEPLENDVHNGPHGWVGGVMGGGSSPGDPVFFLHHCYIDMLWAQWQLRHPGEPFVPSDGAPDVGDHMHPWSTTVGDVLDHRTINIYSYPAGYTQDEPRVTPPPDAPPTITFPAVPEGLTFLQPAIFQVDACENLTFNIANPVVDSGPAGTEFERMDASIVVDPHVEPVARIWISYEGTAAGDHATGHVDVTCVETGDAWEVPIVADVIELPSAAVALVLDQSNSMNEESGIAPGVHRSEVLRFSAPPCVDVMDENHAAMVISFDHDPYLLRGLTEADTGGRLQLNSAIGGYMPNSQGWTAIGEALNFAHNQLDPVTDYQIKATVILTDGEENHGPHDRLSIDDVGGLINERVYAIGLGTPANIQPEKLQQLCNGHQGYMLMTGELNGDAYFRLAKFYQQIISGVTNQDLVLDPDGWVHAGSVVRIPFYISDTDITARAVLLTDNPHSVIFALETPGGDFIIPTTANPMVEFRIGSAVEMYRVSLPLPIGAEQAHVGEWKALIALGKRRAGVATHAISSSAAIGSARYSLSVHALSNLRMRASLAQSSNEPGATIHLSVALTEYAVPLQGSASVRAEVTRPDASQSILNFARVGAGAYEASMVAAQDGVYHFRIIAAGKTMRSQPFTREQTLTGAVWRGGDRPRPPAGGGPGGNDPGRQFCHLLMCLLKDKGVIELLRRNGIDPAHIARCVEALCRRRDLLQKDPAMLLREVVKDDRAVEILTNALRRLDITHD
ncbi:MAG: tyrosinase family protein [Acidobacteria bacterium]|nr:tyrosinase family protein [Acidobacteriota bacterium]